MCDIYIATVDWVCDIYIYSNIRWNATLDWMYDIYIATADWMCDIYIATLDGMYDIYIATVDWMYVYKSYSYDISFHIINCRLQHVIDQNVMTNIKYIILFHSSPLVLTSYMIDLKHIAVKSFNYMIKQLVI